MKTRTSAVVVVVGALVCGYGIPTGTSFYFTPVPQSDNCYRTAEGGASLSSSSAAAGCSRQSFATPRHHHVTVRGSSTSRRHPWHARQQPRRRTSSSKNCAGGHGAAPAAAVTAQGEEQQGRYTRGDLEGFSRSELQGLCKKLNLRAVGKTSELLSRVLENHEQQQRSPSSSSSSSEGAGPVTPIVAAAAAAAAASDVVDEADPPPNGGGGATITQLLSGIDDNTGGASTPTSTPTSTITSTSTSAEKKPSGEVAATTTAAAVAVPTDFLLEDVRPAFDELSDEQWAKVGQLGRLLTEWNSKMNLISRKDIANVMRRHVVPCLAMAKALNFEDGIYVLDVGTGGGLPGLPLAICFPNVKFTLIDGRGKKITAVTDMAERLGLTNVRTFHIRAEEIHEAFDFVMGRAVTNLPKFVGFIDKNLKPNDALRPGGSKAEASGNINSSSSSSRSKANNTLQRGVLYMRGEVAEEELAELGARPSTVIPLQRVLEEAGLEGDVGLGGGVDDRGYSSVFHFTSEAIWNREPKMATP